MLHRRLARRFFQRPCIDVARGLLGKTLMHGKRAGVIVETEAYLGEHDLASHARFGRTKRNSPMFELGGTSYVYLIYGMHNCFNIVTGRRGRAEAVLIRALEPLEKLATDISIASGPGKLSRALNITRQHSGLDLIDHRRLGVSHGRRISADRIQTGPRIGVGYAGSWASEPMRFWIRDNPAVSKTH